ncbi:B56-domain-containing protein [Ramicandelaber brevisporus]|nr:B56-domain-containing protein [Ramicandelaber brevisporus]
MSQSHGRRSSPGPPASHRSPSPQLHTPPHHSHYQQQQQHQPRSPPVVQQQHHHQQYQHQQHQQQQQNSPVTTAHAQNPNVTCRRRSSSRASQTDGQVHHPFSIDGHRALYGAEPPRHLEQLPILKQVPDRLKEAILIRKLRECRVIYDFTDNTSFVVERDTKLSILNEILQFLSEFRGPYSEMMHKEIIYMCAANLLRTLPPSRNPRGAQYDPEDDEPSLESAWAHILMVYRVFLMFIESPDFSVPIAKKYIDQRFAMQLLELFESEDPRERDFAKTTMHRIYGKFLSLRGSIRKAIGHVFMKYAYETGSHNGISELLEILGSIINGFAQPLKQEHVVFLEHTLMPLHRSPNLNLYFNQLEYCVIQYAEKDENLAIKIINYLLRIWPRFNSPKEMLFLTEIENVFEKCGHDQFKIVVEPLFKRLAKCVGGLHSQVIEKALMMFRNDWLATLIRSEYKTVLPIYLPILTIRSRDFWNRNVQSLALAAVRFFQDIDPYEVEKCIQEAKMKRRDEQLEQRDREIKWTNIERCLEERIRRESMSPDGIIRSTKSINADKSTALADIGNNSCNNTNNNNINDAMNNLVDEDVMDETDEMLGSIPDQNPLEQNIIPLAAYARRKSVLPVDEEILIQLSQHKPLDDYLAQDLPQSANSTFEVGALDFLPDLSANVNNQLALSPDLHASILPISASASNSAAVGPGPVFSPEVAPALDNPGLFISPGVPSVAPFVIDKTSAPSAVGSSVVYTNPSPMALSVSPVPFASLDSYTMDVLPANNNSNSNSSASHHQSSESMHIDSPSPADINATTATKSTTYHADPHCEPMDES